MLLLAELLLAQHHLLLQQLALFFPGAREGNALGDADPVVLQGAVLLPLRVLEIGLG
jgi:hypothetical protein